MKVRTNLVKIIFNQSWKLNRNWKLPTVDQIYQSFLHVHHLQKQYHHSLMGTV